MEETSTSVLLTCPADCKARSLVSGRVQSESRQSHILLSQPLPLPTPQQPQPLLLLTPPLPAPSLQHFLLLSLPPPKLPRQLAHNALLPLPLPRQPMPPATLLQQAQALAARVPLAVPPGVLLGGADGRRAVDEEDAGHGESGGGGHEGAGVEGAAGHGFRWGGRRWCGGRVRGFGCAGWAAGLGEAAAHCFSLFLLLF